MRKLLFVCLLMCGSLQAQDFETGGTPYRHAIKAWCGISNGTTREVGITAWHNWPGFQTIDATLIWENANGSIQTHEFDEVTNDAGQEDFRKSIPSAFKWAKVTYWVQGQDGDSTTTVRIDPPELQEFDARDAHNYLLGNGVVHSRVVCYVGPNAGQGAALQTVAPGAPATGQIGIPTGSTQMHVYVFQIDCPQNGKRFVHHTLSSPNQADDDVESEQFEAGQACLPPARP